MTVRDIDHVVIAVHDLAAAKASWEALGFTTTPRAVHPFGTANSLIQLGGNFVELVEIADPGKIEDSSGRFFGFAAHNRDFLVSRSEGMSMLVLTSEDRDADQAAWSRSGLRTYDPFNFERMAGQPDGSEKRVAFRLAFTGDASVDGLGFFVCQQETPESFWKPDYQRHDNGARRLRSVTLATPEREATARFLAKFSGGAIDENGIALLQDRIDLVEDPHPAFPELTIAVEGGPEAARMIPPEQASGITVRLIPV
jgi:catechol 2,3-dioxygenase-like lactoylglutathione lyase family enzyme